MGSLDVCCGSFDRVEAVASLAMSAMPQKAEVKFAFQTNPADYTEVGQAYRRKSIRLEIAFVELGILDVLDLKAISRLDCHCASPKIFGWRLLKTPVGLATGASDPSRD
jgi:hypothetical protein